jgi:hypothetical protein
MTETISEEVKRKIISQHMSKLVSISHRKRTKEQQKKIATNAVNERWRKWREKRLLDNQK